MNKLKNQINCQLLIFYVLFCFLITHAQNIIIGDSILIVKNQMNRGCQSYEDTITIEKNNDPEIVNRTWFVDQFNTSLNDSIFYVFSYGIEKAFLKFSDNWDINAHGKCYGFGGAYRISKDHRLLIKSASSLAIYCMQDTLNSFYQSFWRSFVPLLHDSKYQICGDSLVLFFQTGKALLLDSTKVSATHLSLKKWPFGKENRKDFDKAIKNAYKDAKRRGGEKIGPATSPNSQSKP